MAVAVTNSQMVTNAATVITDNPATADTADLAEVFTFTPAKPEYKYLIEIEVGPTNGSVAYSIGAGEYWAAGSALAGSVAQATKRGIIIEGARYKKTNNTIAITLTPASGKKLLTDHALKIRAIQLP